MEPIFATPTVKDPVCGKDVVPGIARSWDYRFDEKVYHFCGSECRSRFKVDPKEFLSSSRRAESPNMKAPPPAFFQTFIAKIRAWF